MLRKSLTVVTADRYVVTVVIRCVADFHGAHLHAASSFLFILRHQVLGTSASAEGSMVRPAPPPLVASSVEGYTSLLFAPFRSENEASHTSGEQTD